MPWHRRISIRLAFFLCVVLCMVVVAALSALELFALHNWHNAVYEKNSIRVPSEYEGIYYSQLKGDLAGLDWLIYHYTGELGVALVILTVLLGIVLAGFVMYRWKLQPPLEILSQASEKIAGNDLDFHVPIPSQDEMGELCRSFEKMRASLKTANGELWRSVEERRRLNAAFAHDLRTPLTVLRGYNEYLLEAFPAGDLPAEETLSTLAAMQRQVLRLEEYLQGMDTVKTLSEIQPDLQPVSAESLCDELRAVASILWDGALLFQPLSQGVELRLDASLVMEVYQNMLGNATRYARQRIGVQCEVMDGYLYLTVSDDGPGFSREALRRAREPYYRDAEEDAQHFGLGLYISQVLCRKCGGTLLLSSPPEGGAKVTAKFEV